MSSKLTAVTVRVMRSTFFVDDSSIQSLPESLDQAELLIDDDIQLVMRYCNRSEGQIDSCDGSSFWTPDLWG